MQFELGCIAPNVLLQCTKQPYLLAINRVPAQPTQGVRVMLLHIIRFIQMWKRYNASVRELSMLGDRELADIGISRSDIPRVAWEHAEQ
jgi:uncharacterized protein YjiS (DUF1127 family)